MTARLFLALLFAAAVPAAAQDVSRALVAVGEGASGVFVGRGLVATAADAVGDRLIVQARLAADRVVLAQVVASDARTGIALLRVPADATPETWPPLRLDGAAGRDEGLGVATSGLAGVRRGARVRKVSGERPPSYEVDLPPGTNVAGSALLDDGGRIVALVTRVGVGSGPAHATSAASIQALVENPQDWLPTRAPSPGAAPSRDRAPATDTPRVGPPVAGSEAGRRAAVLSDLDSRLKGVAREVTQIGNLNVRYRSACVGQYLAPVGSPWAYPWLIEKAELPECQTLRAEVDRRIADTRASLADIEETARHAGILPGELRDLLRRNGLEDYDQRLRD